MYHCDNCGRDNDNCKPLALASRLGERLDPGSEVPVGECVCCGAFVYGEESSPAESPKYLAIWYDGTPSFIMATDDAAAVKKFKRKGGKQSSSGCTLWRMRGNKATELASYTDGEFEKQKTV